MLGLSSCPCLVGVSWRISGVSQPNPGADPRGSQMDPGGSAFGSFSRWGRVEHRRILGDCRLVPVEFRLADLLLAVVVVLVW